MNGPGKVLIAAPVHPILIKGLEEAGYEIVPAPEITQQSAAELLTDCVGIVTSTRLQLDKQLIDAAPKLNWIGRMGSGMEVIDVPYAVSKGLHCLGSPEGNSNAVAEHALGILLSITKRIHHSAAEVQRGLWLREENRGTELEGRTIAIIGYGHTGSAFARKLQGFDMNVLVYDKIQMETVPDYVIPCDSLDRIWKEADIVSFHVPMAPDTYHYFNAAFLEKCRKPVILLNTARGNVVDTTILPLALRSGRLLGAGFDVWEQEPIGKMSAEMRSLLDELSADPSVVITPHIAGYTHEALYKMSKVLLMKILHLMDL